MHKLRIKKKITKQKALDPIFSQILGESSAPVSSATKTSAPASPAPSAQAVKQPSSVPTATANASTKSTTGFFSSPLSSISISINAQTPKAKNGDANQQQNRTEEAKNRNKTFTQDDLTAAWKIMVEKMAETEKLLIQSLKAGIPELKEEGNFEFTVNNQFQENALKENAPSILKILRNSLENDFISMRVVIVERAVEQRVFTATDKFKLMVEKNPILEELRKRLDLELD